jgi:glutamine amidotransferase
MFMHNGGIGCWKMVKRRLAAGLKDEWFNFVQGSTDSEWAFALFLDSMDKIGGNPSSDPGPNGFGHGVLRKALLETIKRINQLIADIPKDQKTEDARSLLNFAVTDGHSVVCTRYVSSRTDEAASLFFSSGTNWKSYGVIDSDGKEDYKMERRDKGAEIVLIASEPLTFERGMFEHQHSATRHTNNSPRQLGNGTDQLDPHNPQTDRHDPSHHRRVLQP